MIHSDNLSHHIYILRNDCDLETAIIEISKKTNSTYVSFNTYTLFTSKIHGIITILIHENESIEHLLKVSPE